MGDPDKLPKPERIMDRKRGATGGSTFSSNLGQDRPSSDSRPSGSGNSSVRAIVNWLEASGDSTPSSTLRDVTLSSAPKASVKPTNKRTLHDDGGQLLSSQPPPPRRQPHRQAYYPPMTSSSRRRYGIASFPPLPLSGTTARPSVSEPQIFQRHTAPEDYSLTLLQHKSYFNNRPLGRCLDDIPADSGPIPLPGIPSQAGASRDYGNISRNSGNRNNQAPAPAPAPTPSRPIETNPPQRAPPRTPQESNAFWNTVRTYLRPRDDSSDSGSSPSPPSFSAASSGGEPFPLLVPRTRGPVPPLPSLPPNSAGGRSPRYAGTDNSRLAALASPRVVPAGPRRALPYPPATPEGTAGRPRGGQGDGWRREAYQALPSPPPSRPLPTPPYPRPHHPLPIPQSPTPAQQYQPFQPYPEVGGGGGDDEGDRTALSPSPPPLLPQLPPHRNTAYRRPTTSSMASSTHTPGMAASGSAGTVATAASSSSGRGTPHGHGGPRRGHRRSPAAWGTPSVAAGSAYGSSSSPALTSPTGAGRGGTEPWPRYGSSGGSTPGGGRSNSGGSVGSGGAPGRGGTMMPRRLTTEERLSEIDAFLEGPSVLGGGGEARGGGGGQGERQEERGRGWDGRRGGGGGGGGWNPGGWI